MFRFHVPAAFAFIALLTACAPSQDGDRAAAVQHALDSYASAFRSELDALKADRARDRTDLDTLAQNAAYASQGLRRDVDMTADAVAKQRIDHNELVSKLAATFKEMQSGIERTANAIAATPESRAAPEDILAFAETGLVASPAFDAAKTRAKDLLASLSKHYFLDAETIKNQTLVIRGLMEQDGNKLGVIEVMSELDRVTWSVDPNSTALAVGAPTYLEAGLHYRMLRQSGTGRNAAVLAVRSAARSSIKSGGPFLMWMRTDGQAPAK